MNELLNCTGLIILIIIAIAVIYYVFKKGKKGLYAMALYLVTVAEEEWGSDTGKIKFAQVLATIKKTYPIISLFLSEAKISQIIEDALIQMKEIINSKIVKEEDIIKEELIEKELIEKELIEKELIEKELNN